ncbi:hypothetical protein Psuf_039000 [Phytohabitans suffuscus]|uniref:Uncharacterized protein n=1 Tax=Phytohabitans suffuscus TaxID=624315 RepID=A0A6F8YKI6_9ACTN|nr:hypothetical protein Psuf_039000 [Phytohabitans suffuscus]
MGLALPTGGAADLSIDIHACLAETIKSRLTTRAGVQVAATVGRHAGTHTGRSRRLVVSGLEA